MAAAFAAKVPAGVNVFDAAPLTCAGVTTYKAVKVGNVRPADLVAISGIGGLGHLALQYAKICGGTVAAIDIADEKLQLAKEAHNAQRRSPVHRGLPGDYRRPLMITTGQGAWCTQC